MGHMNCTGSTRSSARSKEAAKVSYLFELSILHRSYYTEHVSSALQQLRLIGAFLCANHDHAGAKLHSDDRLQVTT